MVAVLTVIRLSLSHSTVRIVWSHHNDQALVEVVGLANVGPDKTIQMLVEATSPQLGRATKDLSVNHRKRFLNP